MAGGEISQLESVNQGGHQKQSIFGSGADATSDSGASIHNRESDVSFDSVAQKAVPEAPRKTADGVTATGRRALPWRKEVGKEDMRKDHGGMLKNIPNCDQGRLDVVGGVCKREPPGVDGGERASSGAKLYRCIRLDGNPLAPHAESTGKDVAVSAKSDGHAKDSAAQRTKTQDAKSGLHQHVCLSPQQSAIACGEREVLCEIASAPVSLHKNFLPLLS